MERYDLDGIIKGTEKDASLERIGCAKKDEKERIINTTEMEARKNNRKLVSIERDLKLEKFKSMPQTSLIRGTNEIKTEEIPPLRLQQYCRSLKEKKDQFMGLINFKHKLTIQSGSKSPQSMTTTRQANFISTEEYREQLPMKKQSKSVNFRVKELLPLKVLSKQDKIQTLKVIRSEFQSLINISNRVSVKSEELFFKAYVEKGNNGILIKQLLRKRWWWHLEEKDPSKANLIWTEWFNCSAIKNMPEQQPKSLKTCQVDYAKMTPNSQPRLQSIKMLVGQSHFSQLRPRISLTKLNYFKSNFRLKYSSISSYEGVKEIQMSSNNTIHNHIDGCLQLHSKKHLFKNFYNFLRKKNWDPFEFIPLTFYIDRNDSSSLAEMFAKYDSIQKQNTGDSHNAWIVKPGENSNRGYGITLHTDRQDLSSQIFKRLSKNDDSSQKRSIIVQKYIQNCFLINKRKFDIRCYILLTTVNGILQGYWYNDGYIRTSSEEYNFNDIHNVTVHLTNDAVQKKTSNYGKYEDFNKMSFGSFRKYLSKNGYQDSRFTQAYEKIKLIAYYLIAAVSCKIKRKQYSFEVDYRGFQLFGLDYMLDSELKPFLIEANSNPCLETSGVILGKLIPEMIDNVLMTAVDPLFPPPINKTTKEFLGKDYFQSNKFELIFTDCVANDN